MTETQTKKKVPIMTTAMAIMGTGTTLISNGQYIDGGLLIISGGICISLYEAYQVKELPDPVTGELIESAANTLSDEIKRKTQLDENLNMDDSDDSQSTQNSSDTPEKTADTTEGNESDGTSQPSEQDSETANDTDEESVAASKQDISAAEV